MIEETAEETINIIEIKAGELILKVPHTSEGLKVVRAMVTLLEEEFIGEEKVKGVGKTQPNLPTFSPVIPSSKQRTKFKDWNALAKTRAGTLYKEVIDRFLIEYKDGVEPLTENLFQIIREMYGKELKNTSIASYVSLYKRYIRENKLAENPIAKTPSGNREEYKEGTTNLREIPMEQVCKIWDLLPDNFSFRQVKALITTDITQSGARIDACNFTIKEFKENPAFGCLETSPGIFLKGTKEKGEED